MKVKKTISIHNGINESLKHNVKRRQKRELQSDLLKHDVCGPKNHHTMQNHAINTIGPKEKKQRGITLKSLASNTQKTKKKRHLIKVVTWFYTCKMVKNCVDPWVGKIPWSRKWQPTPLL